MPKYNYKCNLCSHNYSETRDVNHPLFHPNCNACFSGKYEEVVSDTIEN